MWLSLANTLTIPANDWQPRLHQRKLWLALESGKRRAIEIAHRRWGKDEIALHFAATQAFQTTASYWHMLPEYAQAKKAIWNAVNPHTGIRRIDEAFPVELRTSTDEQTMFIRFKNGSTWQVVGSDNYKNLVGAGIKGIVFSEWAKADPAALAYLDPMLVENDGWALFITTPEGKNHAETLYNMALKDNDWFAELQTVEDTGFPLERVEKARELYKGLYGEDAGNALIEQEYYCSFDAAVLGSVYGKQMAELKKLGRITERVKHDPNYPVFTAHDMGYDDFHAIVFFQIGVGELIIIDYEEGSGWSPKNVCERLYGRKLVVDDRDMETGVINKWSFGEDIEEIAHRKDYTYHSHHVPWDAGIGVQAAGGRSTVEQALRLGIKMMVHPGSQQREDEAALRSVLPRCWIGDRAKKLVNALTSYHRKWDDKKKKLKDDPEHDWSSHGCDAAELMAKVYRDKAMTTTELKTQEHVARFHKLRREHNLDYGDPYRVKPMGRK